MLKTVNSPYLCNSLTDFDEIWHEDAYCPPPYRHEDRPTTLRVDICSNRPRPRALAVLAL